jgi:Ca2+-binding EF-hand superfamily protein
LVRGSVKEKLQWIFHFYDISNDGKLTKQVGELLIISVDVFIY